MESPTENDGHSSRLRSENEVADQERWLESLAEIGERSHRPRTMDGAARQSRREREREREELL
ncbi:hypothetical protein PanWU01x14_031630, partial [Parasponia andersonii]